MTTARIAVIVAAGALAAAAPASAPAAGCRSGSATISHHHISCKKAKRFYRGYVNHTNHSSRWVCAGYSTKHWGSCVNTRTGATITWR